MKLDYNFVCNCNRGDTYYSIMVGSRQGSLAKPLSLVFLTPRLALSSHQLWSANFDLETYTVAHQECFELLDTLFLQHLAIPGFPQSNHTVSKLSVNADSL